MSEETGTETSGGDSGSWLNALPEPLREAPFIGKAQNLDDALGKLAHAAQYMGTAVKMPSPDADAEAINAFFDKVKDVPGMTRLPTPDDEEGYNSLLSKLGRPEEPSEYALPEVGEFEWSDDQSSELRKYAHEAGLTKNQFAKFAEKIAEQQLSTNRMNNETKMEIRKELRLDWGDTLEDREALIRGWLDKSDAPESMRSLLDEKSLPVDTMKWLHGIAKQFKGDVQPIREDGASPTQGLDTMQAREKIQEILNHPAYFDAADPRHGDMVKQMVEMQKLANPDAAA